MPAINFKPRFAELIRTNTKQQTIRKPSGRFRAGCRLFLYSGLRNRDGKPAELLATATCTSVADIEIPTKGDVILGDRLLSAEDVEKLAKADGFDDPAAFFAFFETVHGLPFTGELITWKTDD